jgi:hypothetical protein
LDFGRDILNRPEASPSFQLNFHLLLFNSGTKKLPKKNKNSGARRLVTQNKSTSRRQHQDDVSMDLYQHGKKTSPADNDFVRSDLRQPTRTYLYDLTPPRNFRYRPIWVQSQFVFPASIAVSPSINENNITFSLNNTNAPNLDYDQYCIDRVIVTFNVLQSGAGSSYLGDLYSAIDYDDNTALGNVSALQQFATCSSHMQAINKSHTREVFPMVSTVLYQGIGTFGYTPSRVWVDKAGTTIPHYGLRTMVVGSQIAYTMEITLTFIIAYRNVI